MGRISSRVGTARRRLLTGVSVAGVMLIGLGPWSMTSFAHAAPDDIRRVGEAGSEADAVYSAPLLTAIADLTVAGEVRTGYVRSKFKHWIDADGDGCNTRKEVLIEEADDPVTVGPNCVLTAGRWYSYYDAVSWTDQSRIDIDHMVPLAEAWESGARTWSSDRRQAYANDLGNYRTLVGVTDSVNSSKGDRDIAEWLPTHAQCRYLREWVGVKIRWTLSVDTAEKAAMQDLASGCSNLLITVPVVA